jgi:tRNA A-37 threonylcarbamoyl transferase component Bud32/2-polyprenyl-3-methyl-5-hydroxy-6-metoxy-1,4-benzoquinol methylase
MFMNSVAIPKLFPKPNIGVKNEILQIGKISRSLLLLRKMGISEIFRLARIYLLDPIVFRLFDLSFDSIKKIVVHKRALFLMSEWRMWLSKKEEIIASGRTSEWTPIDVLGLEVDAVKMILHELEHAKEVILAHVDQDGYFLGLRGPMGNVPQVSEQEFMKRKMFTIDIVALQGGRLGTRKNYRGDRHAFLNELKALHALRNKGLNVPRILDVDFNAPALVITYIAGDIIRERLMKAGVMLRDRDVEHSAELKKMSPFERRLFFIKQGKKRLSSIVDDKFVDAILDLLKKIHSAGIVYGDIKYGNIVIHKTTGKPWLIDFHLSMLFSKPKGSLFRKWRDADIELFNLHFDTEKPTLTAIKRKAVEMAETETTTLYAPAYIGHGIRMGNLCGLDSGFGRWHHILERNLPSFVGKRILDLGANNGSVSLAMLRAGARAAVGVELDEKYIEQGNFLHEAFEWHDNTSYDFQYVHADMQKILEIDLGRFDMAMALCSIYYLSDATIERVIQHVSRISNLFVLQCNLTRNIGRSTEATYQKASLEYAVKALRENGFPLIRTTVLPGYDRPLVIGGNIPQREMDSSRTGTRIRRSECAIPYS